MGVRNGDPEQCWSHEASFSAQTSDVPAATVSTPRESDNALATNDSVSAVNDRWNAPGVRANRCHRVSSGPAALGRAIRGRTMPINPDRLALPGTTSATSADGPRYEANTMKTELEKFYALVEDIKVAMMTTKRADGHLRSRAMATQKRAPGRKSLVRDQ